MNDITTYNPADHLVTISTKQGLKPYYPACWRLYELSIRYSNANFKSEIVHMDPEHDFVIVKACLFLGSDYATSEKKAEAFKQGKLSMLDKIETAAKARAARDFGISTELALDMEDATVDETTPAPTDHQRLGRIKKRALAVGWARDKAEWDKRLEEIFTTVVNENDLQDEDMALLEHHLEAFALAVPAA